MRIPLGDQSRSRRGTAVKRHALSLGGFFVRDRRHAITEHLYGAFCHARYAHYGDHAEHAHKTLWRTDQKHREVLIDTEAKGASEHFVGVAQTVHDAQGGDHLEPSLLQKL